MTQKLNPNRSDNRGGYRENSGRKKNDVEKKVLQIRLTDEEVLKVKEYVKSLRSI